MSALEKYRPSSGTEGACFISDWCGFCQRDINEDCPILANTFVYEVNDPRYPAEWVIGEDGAPKCTAFIHLGDQIPAPRCTQTRDMFDKDETPE